MNRRYYRPKKYRRTPSRRKYTTYKKEKNRDWIVYCLLGLAIALLFNFTYNQGEKSCTTSLEDINFYDVNTREEIVSYPEYKEVSLDYWNSCSGLELEASTMGVSKKERKILYCKALCGLHELEYGYFECRLDKIYCYCEK